MSSVAAHFTTGLVTDNIVPFFSNRSATKPAAKAKPPDKLITSIITGLFASVVSGAMQSENRRGPNAIKFNWLAALLHGAIGMASTYLYRSLVDGIPETTSHFNLGR
jgi:hypothetical protein